MIETSILRLRGRGSNGQCIGRVYEMYKIAPVRIVMECKSRDNHPPSTYANNVTLKKCIVVFVGKDKIMEQSIEKSWMCLVLSHEGPDGLIKGNTHDPTTGRHMETL